MQTFLPADTFTLNE